MLTSESVNINANFQIKNTKIEIKHPFKNIIQVSPENTKLKENTK